MKAQEQTDYQRIERAIAFVKDNFKAQPSLAAMAKHVHVSPFHFQKIFTDWAGVSPKKFIQYLSIAYAKSLLKEKQVTLFEAAFETGLSGTGRLHDLFVNIEGMTPGEYKNGGAALSINYNFAKTPFGNILVASTAKGICNMSFADDETKELNLLKADFPNAQFRQMTDLLQQNALCIFTQDWRKLSEIKLHLKGTDFQLKVWETLLKIPLGEVTTYRNVAQNIESPGASRAVGTAIGSNPVGFLIPCHRVIQSTGMIGGYMWRPERKAAILGWEAARVNLEI